MFKETIRNWFNRFLRTLSSNNESLIKQRNERPGLNKTKMISYRLPVPGSWWTTSPWSSHFGPTPAASTPTLNPVAILSRRSFLIQFALLKRCRYFFLSYIWWLDFGGWSVNLVLKRFELECAFSVFEENCAGWRSTRKDVRGNTGSLI